ncbi:MAG: hypothetical protein QMD11_03555 [Smithella sp.]|nr:hypothetical protein [Smithella sp.]
MGFRFFHVPVGEAVAVRFVADQRFILERKCQIGSGIRYVSLRPAIYYQSNLENNRDNFNELHTPTLPPACFNEFFLRLEHNKPGDLLQGILSDDFNSVKPAGKYSLGHRRVI